MPRAQVEGKIARGRAGLQAQAPALRLEIRLERRTGVVRRGGAKALADDELAPDQPHRCRMGEAERRLNGFIEVFEGGSGPAAEAGQRLDDPSRTQAATVLGAFVYGSFSAMDRILSPDAWAVATAIRLGVAVLVLRPATLLLTRPSARPRAEQIYLVQLKRRRRPSSVRAPRASPSQR